MEMREEIFKPFIQYKDGFSRKVSGTGIGLALARSLAELHEGNLIMDDSQKQNCFILSLPVKHEHTIAISKSEIKLKEDPKEEDPGQLQQKPRYTVLIVEDNVEMLAFVVRQLSPVYQILTATNGVEALKVLEGHTVNLIVSDIMMPEMDGLELCDRIKSDLDYSHIPIVLLTAKTTLQSKIDGLKSGADAYIEKPFSVEYLKVSVANLLSNHEKLHAAFAHSPFIQTNSMAMTKADETFLKTLNEVIVANMQNPDFCLDDMASLLNMSRSSLNRSSAGTDRSTDHREVTPLLGETYLLVPRTGTGNFHHISPRTRLPERKSGILSCRRIRSSFIRDTTSTGHSDQGKRRIRRIFGESESGTGCKNPGLCYKTPSPSQAFHDRYR